MLAFKKDGGEGSRLIQPNDSFPSLLRRLASGLRTAASVQHSPFRGAWGTGSSAPITAIRPVRPGALLDPRRMGAAVV